MLRIPYRRPNTGRYCISRERNCWIQGLDLAHCVSQQSFDIYYAREDICGKPVAVGAPKPGMEGGPRVLLVGNCTQYSVTAPYSGPGSAIRQHSYINQAYKDSLGLHNLDEFISSMRGVERGPANVRFPLDQLLLSLIWLATVKIYKVTLRPMPPRTGPGRRERRGYGPWS
jgi:hypothetical protein